MKREQIEVDSLATLQKVLESDDRALFASALTFIDRNPLAASSSYTNVSDILASSNLKNTLPNLWLIATLARHVDADGCGVSRDQCGLFTLAHIASGSHKGVKFKVTKEVNCKCDRFILLLIRF